MVSKKRGCSNVGKYRNVPEGMFCGPAGGACPGTYPVDTPGRVIAAMAYARHAPNPAGIKACARRAAQTQGWYSPTTKKVMRGGVKSPSKKTVRKTPAKKTVRKSSAKVPSRRARSTRKKVKVDRYGF